MEKIEKNLIISDILYFSQNQTILKVKSQNIPNHLFDMIFEISKHKLNNINQLQGYGTFENFGEETTELHYELILYDKNNIKIHSFEKTITVQTQESLSFNFDEFKNLDLKPVKYNVSFSTLYNSNIKD